MLVIRMQRMGRKGHAQFRVVVQDSRRTPTSGKIVAQLGSYNPHNKQTTLDKEKTSFYLSNGAQPSDRVARLLKAEGVDLPAWVNLTGEKQRTVRNADKRRSTRPVEEPAAEAVEDAPVEEPASDSAAAEADTPAEEPAAATEEESTAEAAPAEDTPVEATEPESEAAAE